MSTEEEEEQEQIAATITDLHIHSPLRLGRTTLYSNPGDDLGRATELIELVDELLTQAVMEGFIAGMVAARKGVTLTNSGGLRFGIQEAVDTCVPEFTNAWVRESILHTLQNVPLDALVNMRIAMERNARTQTDD